MFVFPRRVTFPVVGDVSVIHPAAASYVGGAARTPGFAAASRYASKRLACQQVSSAPPLVPMLVGNAGWRAWPLSGRLRLGSRRASGVPSNPTRAPCMWEGQPT
jgi:hypothetical protein